ncbi:hypothetical protein ACI79D_10285 [Geodermatophilus sp. SYSU D00708]
MTTGRRAYAHDAVLAIPAGGDDRAPGGAVTLALCGSWSHEPPCPLAPHHTATVREGEQLRVRVLFASDPADEAQVRALVEEALARGECVGPDGVRTQWRLAGSSASDVRPGEAEHAGRLARS